MRFLPFTITVDRTTARKRAGGESDTAKEAIGYDVAMRRMVYVACFGLFVIAASGFYRWGFSSGVTVGLMCAGAALLAGGLIGFLFGVPHVRDGVDAQASGKDDPGKPAADTPTPVTYRPSTSLEEISDWLTKMLVGVGLIEARSIAQKVWEMAGFVRKGMGSAEGTEAFALGLIVYFFIVGFIFGFLWARLYLIQWFREVDQVRAQLSRLQKQQLADGKMIALANHLLTAAVDGPQASEDEIIRVFKEASPQFRAEVFYKAQEVSSTKEVRDYQQKLEGAIAVFKALIATDEKHQFFNNYAELSYALSRQESADNAEAERFISEAIALRDQQRVKGWKYYEMRRARYRIALDPQFKAKKPSDPTTVDLIVSDLKVASTESEKWKRWLDHEPDIKEWLGINKLRPDTFPGV